MKQIVKLFIHDLTASRPRVHVDDDINRYLSEHPNYRITNITYNTRALSTTMTTTIREEALVTFDVYEPLTDIFSNELFNCGLEMKELE